MGDNFGNLSSPIKEIGKDTLYYIPAKIIPVLVSFVAIAVYTRLLNPTEYGLYILVITIISTVFAFGFNWIGYVVWRYFERYKNDENLSEFLSTIFTLVAAIFVVVGLLWYAVTRFLQGHMGDHFIHLLRLGIIVLGVRIGFSHVLEIIRLNRQGIKYSLYSSINAVGTLLIAIIFIYILAFGVEGILFAIILTSGSISILGAIWIYRNWKIKCLYISRDILRKILTFGIPQIGIAGGALLLSIADRYMIAAFIGPEGVGIYAVGYTIASMSIQLPLSILILASIPVVVSTFENKGETETQILFRKLLSVYFIVLTPVVFGIAALSMDIVNIVLGEQFQQTFVILPWVAAGVFFFGLSQLTNTPFQLKEKPHLLIYLIFPSAILNIILNLFMIPQFGILGAAYATLIAYFIYCICSYKVIIKFFAFSFPWLTLTKSLLAAIGMYLSLHFVVNVLPPSIGFVILKIGVGVWSYFLILMLLKEQAFLSGLRFLTSAKNNLVNK